MRAFKTNNDDKNTKSTDNMERRGGEDQNERTVDPNASENVN